MGKLTFAPGDHAGRNYYEGEWVCDRMQGKGVLVYACGDKYEGQFANNLVRAFNIALKRSYLNHFKAPWQRSIYN